MCRRLTGNSVWGRKASFRVRRYTSIWSQAPRNARRRVSKKYSQIAEYVNTNRRDVERVFERFRYALFQNGDFLESHHVAA
jgi:CRP-like cAMP-binding protein